MVQECKRLIKLKTNKKEKEFYHQMANSTYFREIRSAFDYTKQISTG